MFIWHGGSLFHLAQEHKGSLARETLLQGQQESNMSLSEKHFFVQLDGRKSGRKEKKSIGFPQMENGRHFSMRYRVNSGAGEVWDLHWSDQPRPRQDPVGVGRYQQDFKAHRTGSFLQQP